MLKELFQDFWAKAQSQATPWLGKVGDSPLDYTTSSALKPVLPPEFPTLELGTLTGLVTYLKANKDTLDPAKLLLVVADVDQVDILSPVLAPFMRREKHLTAQPDLPEAFPWSRYLEVEEFTIAAMTKLVDAADRARLLQFVSQITSGSVKTLSDDGVTQEVMVKKGVSMKASGEVKNPFVLKPYRTFMEIDQPSSHFILRVQGRGDMETPKVALFEADGGAWRNTAMASVGSYLTAALPDLAVLS